MSGLSNLPSVERLLQSEAAGYLVKRHGRPLTLDALRFTLEEMRTELKAEPESAAPEIHMILSRTQLRLSKWASSSLETVINATGVILHTNLGRAPLSEAAIAAMRAVSERYSNLEFDLETGKRGSRLGHAEVVLQRLLNIEAAAVVNNNAAAVLLVLSGLAFRKRVIIARSQLVEIGGGFRVPDVMRQSGAKLVEVGTTNKVRRSDYEEALADGGGLVMRVHRSNFKITGFTEEPPLADMANIAHRAGTILIDDLGSGALLDTTRYGLGHEPMVQESITAGADLICFSGDKLFGGPQSGIIVGTVELIQKIKRHPLARAVRADKTCLAGVIATGIHYLRDEAEREIPIWRMICMPAEEAKIRAQNWAAALGTGSVIPSQSTVGGGSLPGDSLGSYALALDIKSPDQFLKKLRKQDPPIIARTQDNRILLDPRTVLTEQELQLVKALREVLGT